MKRSLRFLLRLLIQSFSAIMGCFFACFRIREVLPTISARSNSTDVLISRNRLTSLSSKERGDSARNGVGSQRDDIGLKDEAKFLKACGALPGTPVEIRKASEKLKVSPSCDKDSDSPKFHSWLPTTSVEKLQLDVQPFEPQTPIKLCQEWGNSEDTFEHTPRTNSCITNAHDTLDYMQGSWEGSLLTEKKAASVTQKKIVHALCEFRKGIAASNEKPEDALAEPRRNRNQNVKMQPHRPERKVDGTSKPAANKKITEYFPGFATNGKKVSTAPEEQQEMKSSGSVSGRNHKGKNSSTNRKLRDVPKWCSIEGTPFRVDAFKYLRGDCSHWFLTHFHLDHYQGLTKSFNHGKIYCSSITARLVNMNIGIPYDKLHILPLNQKVEIAGIDVTCLDANHCPGSIIILFQPPNGKAVLHTGDFRFSDELAINPVLRMCPVHTLILDTTYCNPQYDFPKQEAVIQFVIDAIQAEAFNPGTLFLIGSYTIGKERLFLEVARSLRRKVYVNAAKLRLLKCLEFEEEDMQWFTLNEHESNIHVAPMWTLASLKRLKHVSSQYASRFSLIVAFSPTGWTFGKGKKKSPGRRWQNGTIIRYEVPYSEHCSFTELKDFVKHISPANIIPSVNNDGPESANAMISLMSS